MVEMEANNADLPVRFCATKLIEKDAPIEEQLNLPAEKQEAFEHLVSILDKETGKDREEDLADNRFNNSLLFGYYGGGFPDDL